MTITVLPARNEYTSTSLQTVFNYTFKIFSSTNLNVYVTPSGQDANDATDLTTAYTVDAGTIGDSAGGFITMSAGVAANSLVTIVSNVPESRTTDYQVNGDFIPKTVNDDFDRVVQLTKQIEDRSGRTLAFQESQQSASSLSLPAPAATQYLRWKSDESGLENVDLAVSGPPTNSSVITYSAGNNFTGGVTRTGEEKWGDSPTPMDFGIVGDGVADDTAALTAMDAGLPSEVTSVDLLGLTLQTTLLISSLTRNYYNGEIRGQTNLATEMLNRNRTPYFDTEIQIQGDKSRVLTIAGKNLLWVGTSIPHQGEGTDSYPELVGRSMGTKTTTNEAWSGSHASWDDEDDAFDITTVKALSMTEADRQWGLSTYGGSSAYDDSFDVVTKASKMTCDWRIGIPMAAVNMNTVVLDHNHNDRKIEFGVLEDSKVNLTGVTIGATTVFKVADSDGYFVGDGVGVVVVGINELGRGAGRVTAVTATEITVAIDSTAYVGAYVSGTIQRFERSTLAGSFGFLIFFIGWQVFLNGYSPIPEILLTSAPSEYTNGSFDPTIRSNAEYIKRIAVHYDLPYFDLISSLGINSVADHTAYFPDNVHPTTPATRRVVADHWEKWFNGGTSRTPLVMQEPVNTWVAVVGSPSRSNFGTLGSPGYQFDQSLAESVGMSFCPPVGWGTGEVVGVEINFWPPAGGSAGEDIVFTTTVLALMPGAGLGAAGTVTNSVVDIPVPNVYQSTLISMSVPVSNLDRLLTIHVGRLGASGSDTYTADCYISSINVIFQPDET